MVLILAYKVFRRDHEPSVFETLGAEIEWQRLVKASGSQVIENLGQLEVAQLRHGLELDDNGFVAEEIGPVRGL